MKINGAKILITGGSLGIGRVTAELLIKKGAMVIITGRNKERLDKVANKIGAIPFVADVSDPEMINATYHFIEKTWGCFDCLINNAGIGSRFSTLAEVTQEEFLEVYKVNVIGAALMAKHAAEIFKNQNYGNIVNISSTAGRKGFERGTVYASSKFALRGMTECWQAELRKFNIRVILVNPSEVTTAFGSDERVEREEKPNRLRSQEIAHTIVSTLEMDDRGFIPEVTVFATNPW
jgi:3-oxoacyl-[acyl-carrier protein] reductase